MIISIVWVRFPDKTPRNHKSDLRKLPIWATKRKLYLIPEWQWLKRDSHEGLQTFPVEDSFAFNSYIKASNLGDFDHQLTAVFLSQKSTSFPFQGYSPPGCLLWIWFWQISIDPNLPAKKKQQKNHRFAFNKNGWVQKHVWINLPSFKLQLVQGLSLFSSFLSMASRFSSSIHQSTKQPKSNWLDMCKNNMVSIEKTGFGPGRSLWNCKNHLQADSSATTKHLKQWILLEQVKELKRCIPLGCKTPSKASEGLFWDFL